MSLESDWSVRTGRRVIYVPKDSASALFRILGLRDDENISGTLEDAIDRYLAVIGHSVPEFNIEEWCLIFDALLGVNVSDEVSVFVIGEEVAEAIDVDNLDKKWGVDGDKLRLRLGGLTYAEKQAIAEVMDSFWRLQKTNKGENYSDIVARTLKTFSTRVGSTSQMQSGRVSRRMSPNFLNQDPGTAD